MSDTSRWVGLGVLAAFLLSSSSRLLAQNVNPVSPPAPVLSEQIRANGPPVERPDDTPGTAPGPDLFYVPGEYYPDRNGVVWREGYWAQHQAGWAWVPDRWVRQSDGWTFQEGSWVKTRAAAEAERGAGDPEARRERELVINLSAGGNPTLVRDGVTYNVFDTVANPYAFGYGGLGITPAYTGVPFYNGLWGWGSPWGLYGRGMGWGGWGGWGFPGGFAAPGWGGWGGGFGFGGLGFGLGIGFRPLFWW